MKNKKNLKNSFLKNNYFIILKKSWKSWKSWNSPCIYPVSIKIKLGNLILKSWKVGMNDIHSLNSKDKFYQATQSTFSFFSPPTS